MLIKLYFLAMNDGILVWVAILAASISLFAATIAMLSVHDAVNVTQLKPPAHHTEKPPAHHTESDGSVTFDVVEYSSSTGHVIRCISPGPGKVECY